MRCFVDTNILISAGLDAKSLTAAALIKALTPPNVAIVSDYSLDEMRRVMNKKFPHKARELEIFLERLLFNVEFVSTPADVHMSEAIVRDVEDRPILRAAIYAGVDVLITGDKDFWRVV